ncbi:hypothetical protein SAMN05660485_00123 [Blastococcus fimeti]|nr:hypothetical protein SAMN05660485_00123 [Blastococcus fimeti]
MRRLLGPAAACVLVMTACGGSAEPPSWFAQRTELPSCGIDDFRSDDSPDVEARRCFQDAFAADRPAELTLVQYGDEGEYGRAHFRVLGGARYEIVEQHFDGPSGGSGLLGWARSECDRFVFSDDPGESAGTPSTNWEGECEQVDYVSA